MTFVSLESAKEALEYLEYAVEDGRLGTAQSMLSRAEPVGWVASSPVELGAPDAFTRDKAAADRYRAGGWKVAEVYAAGPVSSAWEMQARKNSPKPDDIIPSQVYLDKLDCEASSDSEAALLVVRQWVRFCPYPEWVLLELPEGRWGALWSQGYGSYYTDMLLEGDYSLLAFTSDSYDEVMRYMAQNLMYPPESHADMFALQRKKG